jgi:hypothetical protein
VSRRVPAPTGHDAVPRSLPRLPGRRCACGAAAAPGGPSCQKCRARSRWRRRTATRSRPRTDSAGGGERR